MLSSRVAALALLALAAYPSRAIPAGPRQPLPRLVLWAWERPEDLRRLPPDTGVAFLAQTIQLTGTTVRIAARRQPLRVAPESPLVAVTRIDVEPGAAIDEYRHADTMAAAVARTARLAQVTAVQIDFDARASERRFYRVLLEAVRRRVSLPLSITALASWCADSWLDSLPVDEAVPMLFRMGPANEPFGRFAASGRWTATRCGGSAGVSLDEPDSLRYAASRLYVFNPRSWDDKTIAQARLVHRP